MNFISLHNDIKMNACYDWLTDSQKNVFKKIFDNEIHNFVNVYGNGGVGKTFLGWTIQQHGAATYFADSEIITGKCNIAVVDNGSNSRKGYRETLRIMELNNIKYVIYLTKNKVEDKVYSLKLDFGDGDINKVIENINSIGIHTNNTQSNDMWKLIFGHGGN